MSIENFPKMCCWLFCLVINLKRSRKEVMAFWQGEPEGHAKHVRRSSPKGNVVIKFVPNSLCCGHVVEQKGRVGDVVGSEVHKNICWITW